MKYIKKFYFDRAKYRVGDGQGNEVFMGIDYKNGRFKLTELEVVDRQSMRSFITMVNMVAEGLIKKKQNVNFSDRIEL
ncbi:MAG: hypothetical protein AAB887_02425 [Patescibacteria group bacterium]